MFALRIVGLVVIVFVMTVFVLQISLPLIAGKPLFPWFRRKSPSTKALAAEVNDLHGKVATLHETRDLTKELVSLETERSSLEKAISRLRK